MFLPSPGPFCVLTMQKYVLFCIPPRNKPYISNFFCTFWLISRRSWNYVSSSILHYWNTSKWRIFMLYNMFLMLIRRKTSIISWEEQKKQWNKCSTDFFLLSLHSQNGDERFQRGALVQLVRIHACHAWGHGFESRTHRKKEAEMLPFFVRTNSHPCPGSGLFNIRFTKLKQSSPVRTA